MKNITALISLLIITSIFSTNIILANKILIPMDLSQTDHLKAYGITYWSIKNGKSADWLLNYRSGSFMIEYSDNLVAECRIRGVSFENISDGRATAIYKEVQAENVNMDVVKLEKTPKIAVYAPGGSQPWDDAVRLVLDYAEVDHTVIYDEEIMEGKLKDYDWVHLHHEDFTGQYGKFWRSYQNAPWYIQMVSRNEGMANKLGFRKVSQMKLAVAKKLRSYVSGGGFMFAMCSAPDSYDVALASEGIDICHAVFDGDPMGRNIDSKLDFTKTFAFENFKLTKSQSEYEISTIDIKAGPQHRPEIDFYTLFEFSAKYDPVPTMLTQNHVNIINGFMGQTTAFKKELIKKNVLILAEREGTNEVKYIHGTIGRGNFSFYGGHDPEDYRHFLHDPITQLKLHKNSPAYRLILNNILFPAAKKKEQKT